MTDDELEVVRDYHKNPLYVEIAKELRISRRVRLGGDVRLAHSIERQVDRLWEILPAELKW